MSTDPEPRPEAGPAPIVPLVWVALTLIVGFLCARRTHVSVDLVFKAAFLLAFLLAGTIGAIGIHLHLKDASTRVRIGGSIACGGLGVLGLVPVAIIVQILMALWAVWIVIAAFLNMR